ncbi:MAG: CRTAC1 family protein [Isosphaeraceae bacterium]
MITRRFAPIAAGLALAAGGCHKPAETAPVPKAVAPVAPAKVEAKALPNVHFVEITRESGIGFVHHNGARGKKLLPETMGSGVAVLDYNGDGHPDLFFVNSCPWPGDQAEGHRAPTQALYRNDGRGHFEDVTKDAGLALSCFGQGVAVGDYDNDGDPDIYITALGGCRLFRNDAGKFTDVTAEAGAGAGEGWHSSAAFFDMDNDGDLDLFVCHYVAWSAEYDQGQGFQLTGRPDERAYGPPTAFQGTLNVLLRNDGGKFADVSEASGIQVRTPDLKVPAGKSLGVAPWDIDGDGLVDLAIANDTVPNFLLHNLGGGKFEEIGIQAGMALDSLGTARGAMGIDWADFRRDGTLGLAIGNFANEMTALFTNDEPRSLLFTDMAPQFGLGAPTQPPLKFGLFFFDYDLDGRPDLLSTNGHLETDIAKVQASMTYPQSAQLFWNSGRPGRAMFVLAPAEAIGPDLLRPIVGRGSAYLDIDGDGDLDVVMTTNGGPPVVCRNDGGNANRWLRLKLIGRKSNRDAVGAKVSVKAGELTQTTQLFPAKGYLSSVEQVLTFGLGQAKAIDSIEILWPSGRKDQLDNVKPDQILTIEEAVGENP